MAEQSYTDEELKTALQYYVNLANESEGAAEYVEAANEIADELAFREQNKQYTPTDRNIPETMADFVMGSFDALERGVKKLESIPKEDISSADKLLFTVSEGMIEPAAEIAGEGLYAGLKILSNLTPDSIEKMAVEGGKDALKTLQSSEVVRDGMKAVKMGVAEYEKWAANNPEWARRVKSFFNIGTVAAPGTKVGKIPGEGNIAAGIRRGKTNANRKLADYMFEPDKDNTLKADRVPNSMGTLRYEPTFNELEELAVVNSVPKFSTNRSYSHNVNVLKKSVAKDREALDAAIIKAGNPKVDVNKITDQFNDLLKNLENNPNTIALTGDSIQSTKKLLLQAVRYFSESDGTVLGLLNARRQLDDWVNRQRPNAYSPELDTALSFGLQEVRTALNGIVDSAVPSAEVQRRLKRQHLKLRARERMWDRSRREQETVIGRWMERSTLRSPTTPLAIAATASAAAGALAAPGVAGSVLAGGAAAGTLWGAYKALSAPKAQVLLGQAIRKVNKQIKTAQGPVLEQLKADRLILIDMLQESKEEEQGD